MLDGDWLGIWLFVSVRKRARPAALPGLLLSRRPDHDCVVYFDLYDDVGDRGPQGGLPAFRAGCARPTIGDCSRQNSWRDNPLSASGHDLSDFRAICWGAPRASTSVAGGGGGVSGFVFAYRVGVCDRVAHGLVAGIPRDRQPVSDPAVAVVRGAVSVVRCLRMDSSTHAFEPLDLWSRGPAGVVVSRHGNVISVLVGHGYFSIVFAGHVRAGAFDGEPPHYKASRLIPEQYSFAQILVTERAPNALGGVFVVDEPLACRS